ncbi:MAG: P-loop NTPase [Gemmatimonadetes bacterium]|nr:P-loop NTPase [Gemmatimonadota bacterium]
MSFRSYHEVTGEDRSALLEQVLTQRRRVAERLAAVKRVVAVTSGKGGVGKSYVAAVLAVALQRKLSGGVGLLDADLKSPTSARMLGAVGPVQVADDGVQPAVGRDGVKVFSTELLLDSGQPLAWREPGQERFIWRGVLEAGAVREFLADVAWGTLDLLLVDLPPGGDRLSDLTELLPALTGAVVVTIPTEESKRSVERAIRAALEAKTRVLGVVENMSGYLCESCGRVGPLFPGSAGEELAREFGVPLLGRIPFVSKDEAEREPGWLVSRLSSPVSSAVDALLRSLP